MRMRLLGRSGVSVSAVGLGGFELGPRMARHRMSTGPSM